MATQGKSSQRPRKPKTSKGVHGGGGKVKLTELEKILLGGGAAHNFASRSTTKEGPGRGKRRGTFPNNLRRQLARAEAREA